MPESRVGLPKMSHVLRPARVRRWEHTLALIRAGKTIAAVAKMRSRTKGTILEHLESLHTLGKLSVQDIAHLARGSEQTIAEIHDVFHELDTEQFGFEKIRETYPNAYRPWDKTQDEKLRELFTKNLSVSDLARTFGRKSGAIRSRLVKLGLIHPNKINASISSFIAISL